MSNSNNKQKRIVLSMVFGVLATFSILLVPQFALGADLDFGGSYGVSGYTASPSYSNTDYGSQNYSSSYNYDFGSSYSVSDYTPSFDYASLDYSKSFDYDFGSSYSIPSYSSSYDYGNLDYSKSFDYDFGASYGVSDYTPSFDYASLDYSKSFEYDFGSSYGVSGYKPSTDYASIDYSKSFDYDFGSSYGVYDSTDPYGDGAGEFGFNTIDTRQFESSEGCCGEEVVVAPEARHVGGRVGGYSHSTPQYERRQTGGGMGIISDLLDLAVGISTTKNDNDTTITTDSHDKINYKVTNTDNSDRSIVNNYTYTDNSKIDNSIVIKNYYSDGDNAGDNDNLRAICRVSATQVRVGDTVNFVANVEGGDTPYEYRWTGDGSGDSSSETFRFNREGTYSLSVRVTDDSGDTDSDDCATVTVTTNGVNNTNTGTNTPPKGNLASLSSVFLSQVPYTGLAGEGGILKIAGYFLGILIWAVAIVYFIAKRKSRLGVKNKMEAFRTFNKFSPKIV